jgi:hypothetical protein
MEYNYKYTKIKNVNVSIIITRIKIYSTICINKNYPIIIKNNIILIGIQSYINSISLCKIYDTNI